MPKKNQTLPEDIFNWLQFVPEAQREIARANFLSGDTIKRLPNIVREMNEKQQETAHWKKQAEYGQQLATSLASFQDVLPNLHEYAPLMRRHKAAELAAFATQSSAAPPAAVVENRQERQEIEKKMRSRQMEWDEGQDELLRLDTELAQMSGSIQRFDRQFNDLTQVQVPQVLAKWEQQLGALDKRRRDDNLETIRFNAKTTKYFRQHPDRDPEELYTALQENPAGFQNFDQLVASIYGEDDVAAQIEHAREEERTKVKTEYEQKQKETPAPAPGEGWFNTGDSAIVRRRRMSEEANRPKFPRNNGEATEQLQQFFQRRGAGSTS